MSININNSNDDSYRYKMEKIIITFGGNGNGVFTTINNIEAISKSLNTPEEILSKYLGHYISSNYNEKKKTYTGHHHSDSLQLGIFQYIKCFILCPTCGIPELNYEISKCKDAIICCSACGKIQTINPKNKVDIKCFDNINKFLSKGNKWHQIKGNTVVIDKQSDDSVDTSNFNPF
jgi:translation initiation factor 2 beta subunit (eIF-2beta)/eIF-5